MAIDLKRSVIGRELGTIPVDANSYFQAGNILEYEADSSGNKQLSLHDGTGTPCGVAKWDRATTLYDVAVNESITFTGADSTVSLAHANVSSVKVTDSTDTTTYTVTTDYTVNTTNGTVTQVSTGSIGTTETVHVTYTYQMTAADIDQVGRNFNNTTDDTAGSDRITVIQGFSTVFTDQYDTGVTYTIGAQLYADANGKFTVTSSGNEAFGRCIFVPTAADPYLGVEGNLGY